jgi:hypothetical protein
MQKSLRRTLNPYAHLQLRRQLYLECRAMAEYALAKGKSVPPTAIMVIESFEDEISQDTQRLEQEDVDTPKVVRPDSNKKANLEDLVRVHELLVAIVEPASPKSILLLDMEEETPTIWKLFGPVPLIRHMMLVAIISLSFFVYFIAQGSLDVSNSKAFSFSQLLFLIASAGMGASFVALYSANEFTTKGTFDPAHYASYWIRFLLGVMSGVVLAIVVSDELIGSKSSAGDSSSPSALFNDQVFRPLMAILGGFSADLVYTLLNRLVETFKSLFQGSAKAMVAAKTEEARAKQETRTTQNRMKLAADLLKMKQELGTEASGPDVQAKLDKLLEGLIPEAEQTSFTSIQKG